MAQTLKQVWTPKAVSRENKYGLAFLSLRATWDTRRDTLSFDIDGQHVEWYRRGMPVFENRAECSAWIASKGYPHG